MRWIISIERIKSHFDDEAKFYDNIIKDLIPYYEQMIDAMVSCIPFSTNDYFSIVDLGCGTGTISKNIKDHFPNAQITCVDISQNMLDIAKNKLGNDVSYLNANFYDFEFPQKYDLIVSSLALHHLEDDNSKLEFYKKIYSSLEENGIFINIDVVLGSDNQIQDVYMKKWQEFMLKAVSKDEIENKWLPNYYAEDRPVSLINHFDMLEQSGFSVFDVIYKYFNFCVYLGEKWI